MKSICVFLHIYLILTVVLGLDPYSGRIGHVTEPDVARRCINLAAFTARLRAAHLCRLDKLFFIQVVQGLAGTHSSPSAITYASPLSSAAIRPDPNSLPSSVEHKQGAAASQAISVAAQHFTYAALLILCSCDRTGQVKNFKFNSSENCKFKDHHSLTPMPGFSLAYLGYIGPGNSAGNMTALLPDWNSEAIPMMQRVLIQSSNAKINRSHNSDSVRATPKTGIRMWGLWKERFQAVQAEEHISTEAKNSARAALAQMVKVEMLSKTDRQEWYKNTIYYQERAAREPNPEDLARELHMRRARLESLRREIISQRSDERIPDRSAGDTQFETGETPIIGIGSTEIHRSPNFSRVWSFISDTDEIQLESGQTPGDATSYRVFLDDFLDRSEVESRAFRYVCLDVSENASLQEALEESKEDSDREASKRASENGFDKPFHESGTVVSESLSGSSAGGSPPSSETSSNAFESTQKVAYKA